MTIRKLYGKLYDHDYLSIINLNSVLYNNNYY